jgi:hypothetical protein
VAKTTDFSRLQAQSEKHKLEIISMEDGRAHQPKRGTPAGRSTVEGRLLTLNLAPGRHSQSQTQYQCSASGQDFTV